LIRVGFATQLSPLCWLGIQEDFVIYHLLNSIEAWRLQRCEWLVYQSCLPDSIALCGSSRPSAGRWWWAFYHLTGKDKREEEQMLKGISRKTNGRFRKQKAKTMP